MIGDMAEIRSLWLQPAPGVGAAGRHPWERGRQLLVINQVGNLGGKAPL